MANVRARQSDDAINTAKLSMMKTPSDAQTPIPPTCIAGMHRSGTSMVAAVLRTCGLYLGFDEDLCGTEPEEPSNHFENRKFVWLNERILELLGGASFDPPTVPHNWIKSERLEGAKAEAAKIIKDFAAKEPWGWKDPRNSLTFPFWAEIIGQTKVIICLRHPLEVADSLRIRATRVLARTWPRLAASLYGIALWKSYDVLESKLTDRPRVFPSYGQCINLWLTYNRQILASTSMEWRLITHYDAYFRDPKKEIYRLLNFLNLSPKNNVIDRACSIIRTELRHHNFRHSHSEERLLPPAASVLHNEMCREAEFL